MIWRLRVINLTRDQVKEELKDGKIVLVDVREPHEFLAGHIPGAVSLPLSRFDMRAITIPEGQRAVFVCVAGVRSAHAMAHAKEQGFDIYEHYAGGMNDWISAGEVLETI